MSSGGEYELVLTPPARRALTERLAEPVAAAVIDFVATALVAQPRRVGNPLRDELAGIWAARRGTYRVLYRVRDDTHEVIVCVSNTAETSIGRSDPGSLTGSAPGIADSEWFELPPAVVKAMIITSGLLPP